MTLWIGEGAEVLLDVTSYVDGERGDADIVLRVHRSLDRRDLVELKQVFREDSDVTNWASKIAEKELLNIEHRVISRELLSAKQRYNDLIKNRPGLLKRVPVKHIASYLGITQVSLSRIRREK